MNGGAMAWSAGAMVVIVAARYLATSGLFAWLTHRMRPGLYAGRSAQIRREIGWSMVSAILYGAPAGVVAWGWANHGWTRVYTDWHAHPVWLMPLSVLAYLVAHDAWFYWTHRWMHRPGPFRMAHAVHHASRPPTAWAAMAFHPAEALSGAIIIPALAFIIPIHAAMLGVVLAIMTMMGITNHMGWEMLPAPWVRGTAGRWIITATHHQRHHQEYRGNYGLYFRFWDWACGTDLGLGHFHPAAAKRG
ncbi:MAG: sterol desaturase family protein [Sphingopyxis sp.]